MPESRGGTEDDHYESANVLVAAMCSGGVKAVLESKSGLALPGVASSSPDQASNGRYMTPGRSQRQWNEAAIVKDGQGACKATPLPLSRPLLHPT